MLTTLLGCGAIAASADEVRVLCGVESTERHAAHACWGKVFTPPQMQAKEMA